MRKRRTELVIAVEHRAAAAPEPFAVRLVTSDDDSAPAYLTVNDESTLAGDEPATHPSAGAETELCERVLGELGARTEARSREALRATLGVRNERLGVALRLLEAAGRAERTPHGLHDRAFRSSRSLEKRAERNAPPRGPSV